MKRGGNRLAALALAALAWAGLASGVRGQISPLFTLDTRILENAVSAVFTLDTRDADAGTVSALFTLDTRGDLPGTSALFTLDTRDLDRFYVPENLALVAEQPTVARATWDCSGSPLGFVLARRAPQGEWGTAFLSNGALRSWADVTVQPGEFYEYRIAATWPDGVSDYSEVACIQMPSLPAAPHSLCASLTEAGGVSLAWQDASFNEDGFEIWRRTEAASDWNLLAQTPSNAASHFDGTVAPGTLYAYKVRAFNAWGHSGFSSESSVATPDSEGGCGYLLRVESASLALDGVAAATNAVNPADARALLTGPLSAWIRSPPGNAHPVRVVLGFRDEQGAAVGTPVELENFYRVPGCPGLAVPAEVPEAFRAPESGTNGLWLELILAQRDPLEAFRTEHHVQESPMRKRLFAVAIRPAVPSTRVRVLDGAGVPGRGVAVPVEMISTGGEFRVAFSVGFGSGVVWTGIQAGADAPQVLAQAVPDTNGAVGVILQAPAENPFGAGAKQVATLQFLAVEAGDYVLHVQDEPVAREIDGRGTGIQWEDGRIAVAAAELEGDVYPRPNGDGVVDDDDVHLALMFALGLVDPPADGSEFQRLDCAPLETCGDGQIDMADKVAIQRYAKAQDPLRDACGPTDFAAGGVRGPAAAPLGTAPRSLALVAPAEALRGQSFTVQLDLDALGDERALAFSLVFDPDAVAYRGLQLRGAATNGVFLANEEGAAAGALAFGVTLADAAAFIAGEQTVAEIAFQALEGGGSAEALLAFAETPAECRVAGADSASLACDYYDAMVHLSDPADGSAAEPPTTGSAVALATNRVQVSWSAVTWATGYRIRRMLADETAWTRLADFDETRTAFVDEGLPTDTLCHYLITSLNPNGAESSFLRLSARTWSRLEQWRSLWLAQVENEGQAADAADPDDDALPNGLEHQLGTDPLVANAFPFLLAEEELFPGRRSVTVTYSVRAGAPGDVAFDFTENLLAPAGWGRAGMVPVSLRSEGAADVIKLRLPEEFESSQRLFLRMRTE
ncbi:MAG: hypothetical protein AB7V22_03390 [Kiritimatiellia bacterium]